MKKTAIVLAAAALAILGPAAQAKTMNRGLGNPKSVYIERGSWQLGIAGGYNRFNAGGLNGAQGATFLGLVNKLDGDITFANASASAYYFVANNISVGARLGFAKTGFNVDNASLLSQISFSNTHADLMTLSGALAARAYLPLFNSKCFALFAEARLSGKMGYNKNYEQYEKGKTGTYADVYSVSLGLYPGICFFLTNNIAVELSLPLVEGGYEWNKQLTNDKAESAMGHAYGAFQPSILGLNLGITFNF